MFILRPVKLGDLDDLFNLSQFYTFINLPSNRQIIREKIQNSISSFSKPSKIFWENDYFFVLEDIKNKKIVGASMIHAQHGTEEEPHFYLKVGQENKFSETINTGFIHGTLKLGLDTDGPSEIGGLILDPEYRGHSKKLGKQLSFVRFLFMGLNPKQFKKNIHAELMPPFDRSGKSPLWEAIGRRFMNMDYQEADLLSRNNKEFILSLYPSDTIYETLLPLEARNAIGKVGKDTQPVKRMLEKIGFEYTAEVDPFDGGPHYRCALKEIKPVKEMQEVTIKLKTSKDEDGNFYLITLPTGDDTFLATMVKGKLDTKKNTLSVTKQQFSNFKKIKEDFNSTIIPL